MYKAVLFDLFGTLIPAPQMSNYRQMVADIADIYGVAFETLNDPWMSINDGRLDGSFGSSEGDIYAAAKLIGVEVDDDQLSRIMDLRRGITREFLRPKPGAIEMLAGLKDRGLMLGLVTDCVYDVPAVWPETEFARFFSAHHFSCETHIRKPDARTYQHVLSALAVEPKEALFIGDGGSDELNGAERCGIDAVMIDDRPADAGEMLRVGVGDWAGRVIGDLAEVIELVSTE